MANRYDPILLEVFRNLLFAASEEMGVALCRSSFSPNIKERKDYSCAIFDTKAQMAAQAAHLPAHLGSMPMSVEYVIERMVLDPGDVVVLNDPFHGGNHLPDITMISPVYGEVRGRKKLIYYVANRAHHADVGGIAPGSMSITTEIFQDGVVIPPVKLVRAGEMQEDVFSLILANVRTAEERRGDIAAQIAANRVGERRILEIIERHGLAETLRYTVELQRYSERLTKAVIRDIPDGRYGFEDFMDDDGFGSGPVPIRVEITVRGSKMRVDYTGSAPQTQGSVNAVESIARTAAYYALRCLVPYDIPNNSGCMDPIEVIAPSGTVVNAEFPAAVAGGKRGDEPANGRRDTRRARQGLSRQDTRRLMRHDEQPHRRGHGPPRRPPAGPPIRLLRDNGRRHGRRPLGRWGRRHPHPSHQHLEHPD